MRAPMDTFVAIDGYLIVLRYALCVTRYAGAHGCTHCICQAAHILISHCLGGYALRVMRYAILMGTLVALRLNLILL